MENVLIGYGGFAREIIADIGHTLKCFVDDEYADNNTYKLSSLDPNKHRVLIAIGNPEDRKRIFERLPKGITFWNHISKWAIILDPLKYFGNGSIICAGSVITTNVHIGDQVHININSTIGHDSFISDFVTVSPGVNISGNVFVDKNVFIGTNSSIRERINITSDVIIGMNTGVIKQITTEGIYVGTPNIKKPNP
jgi:sugar O-acyltransferase (sialic acid O-acetyltransferase NeuD family)